MNADAVKIMAAPEMAPALTPSAGGGFAGVALLILFAMLYVFGTSPRRAKKLPDRNVKALKHGRKQVRVRKPVGPFNPDNWTDVDGDGIKDAPLALTIGVVLVGLIDMEMFMKVREVEGNSFWAKPAHMMMEMTVKMASMPVVHGINPVYVGFFLAAGVVVAPWFGLKTKFFLALMITGFVSGGGGILSMLLEMASDTSSTTINSVVGQ